MQRVLITGGNKGIGLAATKRFLDEGYKVCVLARDFSGMSLDVEKFEFDLEQTDKIPNVVKEIGHIDILINNAGIMNTVSFDKYTNEERKRMLAINLESPVALLTEFSKSMRQRNGGRIVNVASIAGHVGHPDVWYGITKAGLINATKIFAKILGKDGIIVTSVAPGPVSTEMLNQIPDERLDGFRKSMITENFAEPEQIVEIIFWLASSAPDQVNGICVDANNGIFMR